MSPRWSLRASSPQLPKLGMELKINTMDGELIERTYRGWIIGGRKKGNTAPWIDGDRFRY